MPGQGRIKVGPGREALAEAGYQRREQLKSRLDLLQAVAEKATQDSEMYSVDESKLKEEPEILKHFDFMNYAFTVSKPVRGKVYYWERDDHRMISYRKAQARFYLGPNHKGWEVVSGLSETFPECEDLMTADGTRKIGDVVLMRIDTESYINIQKKIMLANKFREQNIPQKLSDFVNEHEGLVQVHQFTGQDPRGYFAAKGTKLVHTDGMESNFSRLQSGTMAESNEGIE